MNFVDLLLFPEFSHLQFGITYNLSKGLLNMYDIIFLELCQDIKNLCIDDKHHKNPSPTIKSPSETVIDMIFFALLLY